MKKTFLALFLLVTSHYSLATSVYAANCEVRGTWINAAAVSPAVVSTTLTNIIDAHLNTVFVLAPPIGDNKGWITEQDFSNFISRAKNAGLSVHIWVANAARRKDNVWADFTSETEQNAQVKWVESLLQQYQDVDGIHLDYLRYPSSSTSNDLSLVKMSSISATVKKIYQAVNHKKFVTAAVKTSLVNSLNSGAQYRPSWFISWLSTSNGQNFIYNTSVGIPDFLQFQQDPVSWVKGGYIDGIMPMMYYSKNADTLTWKNQLATYKNFLTMDVDHSSKIFNGLGWFIDTTTDTHYEYNIPGVLERIDYTKNTLGLKGNVFFEFSHKDPGGYIHNDSSLVTALASGPYQDIVPSCLALGQKNTIGITGFRQLLSQFTSIFFYNELVVGYGH